MNAAFSAENGGDKLRVSFLTWIFGSEQRETRHSLWQRRAMIKIPHCVMTIPISRVRPSCVVPS